MISKTSFTPITQNECVYVVGGVDKNVKDIVYYIGYLIGKLVSLFTKKINRVSPSASF